MLAELSPVRAVTHRDPYPYYAALVAERPCYFDDELQCWVASSAAAVTAVLASSDCRVRPATEPVPSGIAGTAAGEVFGNLVRMTDGEFHDRVKAIVVESLGGVSAGEVSLQATECARSVLTGDRPVEELMFGVPAQVVARLCGLDDGSDERASRLIGEFVKCLPATADADQLRAAASAAEQLQALLGPRLTEDGTGLLGELVRAARRADWTEQAPLLANGIGLLSQTYDATAALIGNCLVALARSSTAPAELPAFVREVARHDSPVHSTRRFVAAAFDYAGCQFEKDQSILLLLAAANRDPAANPDPAAMRPDREHSRLFTFGAAGHGCPGETLALGIATAAVRQLVEAGLDARQLCGDGVRYLPSGNIRTPVFPGPTVLPGMPERSGDSR